MDSGLGSDDEKRNKSKAQKQYQNEQKQFFSSCFIDATSLGDECEFEQHQENERRQGSLIFRSSIPQYSMLQMSQNEDAEESSSSFLDVEQSDEMNTPHNSMVHLDLDTPKKNPIGFYVDLGNMEPVDKKGSEPAPKKNIFSITIDFNAPKREMPSRLNSSLLKTKKKTVLSKNTFSSSVSSLSEKSGYISDSSSNLCLDPSSENCSHNENSTHCKSSENVNKGDNTVFEETLTTCVNGNGCDELTCEVDNNDKSHENVQNVKTNNEVSIAISEASTTKEDSSVSIQTFVKLSDLKEQRSRPELVMVPRMSRSIPETSWLESPLAMLHSASYRSSPRAFQSRIPEPIRTTKTNEQGHPKRSVRKLGTDLLKMFLEEINTDIYLDIAGRKVHAHRCILASRCHYFAAVLSGNAPIDSIPIQGFSYAAVHFALCHIYSGAAHIPDSISVLELAALADMLGLEGLKEVVSDALQTQYCHDFHDPCAGCINGVPEIIPILATYGLDEPYQESLQWITKYFLEVWPTRMFASLPRELRDKCYQQHIVHMAPTTLLETMISCNKLLTTMPTGKWAEPIAQLTLQLSDHCQSFLKQHFAAVLASSSFVSLNTQLTHINSLEDILIKTTKILKFDQACNAFAHCHRLLQKNWNSFFTSLLHKINTQLESCLIRQESQLTRSSLWTKLEPSLRKRIRDLISRQRQMNNSASDIKNNKQDSSNLLSSSSDSSRLSSPLSKNGVRSQLHSPSLRRNLLLAARISQTSSSPTSNRRISTLTNPTKSSAAKSASTVKNSTIQKSTLNKSAPSAPKNVSKKPITSKVESKSELTVSNRKKGPTNTTTNLTSVRNSATKKFSNAYSKVNSTTGNNNPTKKTMQASHKEINKRTDTVKESSTTSVVKPQSPIIRRSDTFLKDEPTILNKL